MKIFSKQHDIDQVAALEAADKELKKAAHDLKMAETCTVCGHTAGEHWKYDLLANAWYMTYSDKSGCLAKVWVKRAHQGVEYEKSEQCDCPLTPDEVLHNASK